MSTVPREKHRAWRGKSYRPEDRYDGDIYKSAIEDFLRANGKNKFTFRMLVDLALAKLFSEHSDEFKTLYKAQVLRDRPRFDFLKEERRHDRTEDTKTSAREAAAR